MIWFKSQPLLRAVLGGTLTLKEEIPVPDPGGSGPEIPAEDRRGNSLFEGW